MMATVDAKTGAIYEPPLSRKGSLYVPLDNLSNMEIHLRPTAACSSFETLAGTSRTETHAELISSIGETIASRW
jgi:hypothetical protein